MTDPIETLTLTRRLPHSIEAEMALLGAILVDGRGMEKIADFLRPEHFSLKEHRLLFEAIGTLSHRGRTVDTVTLKTWLMNDGSLEAVGGVEYLTRLADAARTVINVTEYGALIHDLAVRRELIAIGEDMVNRAYQPDPGARAIEMIEQTEQALFELADSGREQVEFTPFRETLKVAATAAEKAYKRDGALPGVTTGLRDVDGRLGGLHPSDLVILAGRPGMGKAQPLDTPVLTANGWKVMGNLYVGEELASIDGGESYVEGIYPQGKQRTYLVTFSDGRSTECCDDHLWKVYYRKWPGPRVIETHELIRMLGCARYKNRLWIDVPTGDFGCDQYLPIDPWVLGALIGNGNFDGGTPVFSTADTETLDRLSNRLGSDFLVNYAGKYSYRIAQRNGCHTPGVLGVIPNPLTESLKKLGLHGLKSYEKFIPYVYFTAGKSARLDLLRGLLDTDGWTEKSGSVRFCTSSQRLANDVVHLVRSLGGLCSISRKHPQYTYNGDKKAGREAFVCKIRHSNGETLFHLNRKSQMAKRASGGIPRLTISSISPSRVTETQCIRVSHPSHLYITTDFIVTHNTALATNMAFAAAKRNNSIGFFSLEMSKEQLATRVLGDEVRVSSDKIRRGLISWAELERVVGASTDLGGLPIFIDDSPGLSIQALRSRARRLKRRHGLGMLVIDYLQLIGATPGRRQDNRVQELSEITRGLKCLAKELHVPVLALSQLSRQVENREDKRPQLSDLRESGTIEQDADVVMFIYRDQYYLERAEPSQRADEDKKKFIDRHTAWQRQCEAAHGKADLAIAKQRHGPIGTVKLRFEGEFTRFSDIDQGRGPQE